MKYYIIILYLLLLLSGLYVLTKNDRNKSLGGIFALGAFVILVLFRTFIDIDSLPDVGGYEMVFNEFKNYNFEKALVNMQGRNMESGYLFLTKLCTYLSSDFHAELFVIACIIVTSYFIVIKKYSDYLMLSFLVYFLSIYPVSTYILRQYLAMAILFPTIYFIIERKLAPYIAMMVIAFFIHKSSLIWFPLYFIYGVRKRWAIIVLIVVMSVALVMIDVIFGEALSMMGGEYTYYMKYLEQENATSSFTGFLLNLFDLLLFLYLGKKTVFDEGINRLMFFCCLISTILSFSVLIDAGVSIMFRLVVYFSQMNILLKARLVYLCNTSFLKCVVGTVCVVPLIYLNFHSYKNFHDHEIFIPDISFIMIAVVVLILIYILTTKLIDRKRLSSMISKN